MDLLDKVTDAVEDVADTVVEAGEGAAFAAAAKIAEVKVKEYTQRDISIEKGDDIPLDWMPWILTTGLNSLKTDDSWDFLDFDPSRPAAKKRVDNWNERGINKIVMNVHTGEVDKYETWRVSEVTYDGDVMTLTWWPRAQNWSGANKWWILRNAIVFGLQLYQIEGKCFYKSDWVEGWEDIDPNSCLPNGTTKYKRWLQFRHWTIMWFGKARAGWNYPYTRKPPKNDDGTEFTLDSILDLPDMPSLPSISFPTLPDIEMPEMPTVELPDAPSIEAPSLEAPSIDPSLSAPSMEDRKERPENPWAVHGIMELDGLNVKADGKNLILSDATIHNFWKDGSGIKSEKEEHKRFELTVTSSEQAESWVESLKESGAKDGDVGGCCTIA